jgi:hypothetical protein
LGKLCFTIFHLWFHEYEYFLVMFFDRC